MAEGLISVLLEKLVSITRQQIENEVRLVVDVKKEVAKITSNLRAIQAVLDDAEKKQVKEAAVRDWLDKLKDVSHEIDNVLDEWNTEFLKQQVAENQEKEGEHSLVSKKVFISVPSPFLCFGQARRVIFRRDVSRKIKDLSDRLIVIAKERETYHFQFTKVVTEQPEQRKTGSFVNLNEIFGREDEKDNLVRKLLNVSIQEGKDHFVIPIVGMGGIGKTTLARLAYNDVNVKAHFEKKIWVCVSDPFDEMKVAKAIIEGLNKNDSTLSSNELEPLLQCIHESIEDKKFLLVLDDMWTTDYRKWEQLKLVLQNGAIGSKILVTTRKEEVASMMRAINPMIRLAELGEQTCWLLFHHIAFFGKENDEFVAFETIGKEIVKKCQGLPLGAKTLGSLMYSKKTIEEWQYVLDSKIWELEEIEEQVFQPLLLSYYDLTPVIKRCLLYCAVFPKDYEIGALELINLWMSQDYIDSKRNKEKEIIGQTILDKLVMRSFFQDVQKNRFGNISHFKMHDLVHDFLKFLCKDECFITEVKDVNDKTELSEKVRHLTITFAPQCPFSFGNSKNLRTLRAVDSDITTIDPNLILQLKCLRTLNLSNNLLKELPKEIGELVHLRHLDLSHNPFKELSDSLCTLYNLQTLLLTGCWNLEKLPKAMADLISLKHLYLMGCEGLHWVPKGIGRLTSLRTLDWCTESGSDDSETFNLGDLRRLDQLHGELTLRELRKVKDASVLENAQLWNKVHLVSLALSCGTTEAEIQISDAEILDLLRPHQGLKGLCLERYDGITCSPNWLLSLSNLRHLELSGLDNCKTLPPLGKLPSLESLELFLIPRVNRIGVEFLGIEPETQTSLKSSSPTILFPKLKKLYFQAMTELEVWEGVEEWRGVDSEFTVMPCLDRLYILECGRLRTLPDFLQKTPLRELNILLCSRLQLYGEEWPKISHIPIIRID